MFGDAEHYKYLTNEADLNNAADDSLALTPKTPKREESKLTATSPQTPIESPLVKQEAIQSNDYLNSNTQTANSPSGKKQIAGSLGNMSMAESMDGSFYNGFESSKNVNLIETDNIPVESRPKSAGYIQFFFILF